MKKYTRARTHARGRASGRAESKLRRFCNKNSDAAAPLFYIFNATASRVFPFISQFFLLRGAVTNFSTTSTTTSQKYCGMKYVALKSAYLQMRSSLAPPQYFTIHPQNLLVFPTPSRLFRWQSALRACVNAITPLFSRDPFGSKFF